MECGPCTRNEVCQETDRATIRVSIMRLELCIAVVVDTVVQISLFVDIIIDKVR